MNTSASGPGEAGTAGEATRRSAFSLRRGMRAPPEVTPPWPNCRPAAKSRVARRRPRCYRAEVCARAVVAWTCVRRRGAVARCRAGAGEAEPAVPRSRRRSGHHPPRLGPQPRPVRSPARLQPGGEGVDRLAPWPTRRPLTSASSSRSCRRPASTSSPSAAVLHGAPVTTLDSDIVPEQSGANVARRLAVLRNLEAHILATLRVATSNRTQPC